MGNQGKGKKAWKGTAKGSSHIAKSLERGAPKPSKNFGKSRDHHDSLKGNLR